jgi:hypothetical protein
MNQLQVKTHSDGIWISHAREQNIVHSLYHKILQEGFAPESPEPGLNFGLPYQYRKGSAKLHCRLVDSVWHPSTKPMLDSQATFITDSHALQSVAGTVVSVLPEFWHIWHFEPEFLDRPPTRAYNCFMNRPRGDRSYVFYDLIRRHLLSQGLVSYNCHPADLESQFYSADMHQFQSQHDQAMSLVPYNTVEPHGTLEQCIIDSRVSLILETYTADTHIVFSEKLFRALQLPRPWLLYCSPGAIALLQHYGFDVLDDMVDIDYDDVLSHGTRLTCILDQLEHFINKQYTTADYQRFHRAAEHNRQLLQMLESRWPEKLNRVLEKIGNL